MAHFNSYDQKKSQTTAVGALPSKTQTNLVQAEPEQ